MRVLITGGTGFVGRHLAGRLEHHGHHAEPVSRRPNVGVSWEKLEQGVGGCDAVVHLAGAGVMERRWSAARKREILESRTETTRRVAEACAALGKRLISTSAVGYYGLGDMDQRFDEDALAGSGFLADVCRRWEEALAPARSAVPLAIVRVGVVLGQGGGALQKMTMPFRLGAGGPIGSGRQPFPWIHVDDLVRLYVWLLMESGRVGVFNGVAPNCCDQRTFARALGRAMRRPAFLPTPPFALRLALGERAEILTTGQHVLARRAIEQGFVFDHPEIEPALVDLVRS
ncbi:MAG: TIGR01777 family oxidoreductase [Planctomycetota bacterium]|nr:TIGR01777 family oxidoreductase [Planctomycetota bacterium]